MNKIKKEFDKIQSPINTKELIMNNTIYKKIKFNYKYAVSFTCILLVALIGSITLINNKNKINNEINSLDIKQQKNYIIGKENYTTNTSYRIKYSSNANESNGWLWPASEEFILLSSYRENHYGIDVISSNLNPNLFSVEDGTVISSGLDEELSKKYGNIVIIKLDNGYYVLYAHCDEVKVKVGDKVKKGDIIATLGKTGEVSGPCLHFGIFEEKPTINSKGINPTLFYLFETNENAEN